MTPPQSKLREALEEARAGLRQALDMVVDACRDGTYSVSEFEALKALAALSTEDNDGR